MTSDLLLVLSLVGLLVLATGALLAGGIGMRTAPTTALLRAAGQLAVVSLVLHTALTHVLVGSAFVLVMLAAVGVTAGARLGGGRRRVLQVLAASAAGAVPVLLVLLGPAVFPRTPRYGIAFAGIVLGSTMTVCTLAGRRLSARVADGWLEVEGWLALGATSRQAVTPFLPGAVREALLPGIDQTRTTGLVTLPGTFVGALAGGASPAGAARFQLAVLAALLAAQALSAVVLVRLLAGDLAVGPPPPGR